MAEILWLQGDTDTTYATIQVRSDTAGVLTANCNGSTFTGTTLSLTGDADGWGKVTITGLSADSIYAVTLAVGALTEAASVKTYPASGVYTVACGSCITTISSVPNGYNIQNQNISALFLNGDTIYCADPHNIWGETPADAGADHATAIDYDTYYGHHRQELRQPGMKSVHHYCANYRTSDDHDYPGGNWDNTEAQCNDGASGTPCGDAAELAAVKAACEAVMDDVYQGNRVNTDSGIDADASYFRVQIGDCEFFVLECIRYRDSVLVGSTMLGANQLAWLKAKLKSSTATFKCIVSSKMTLSGGGDGWDAAWATERDDILDDCDASTDWVKPKGVFWICGDRHLAEVQAKFLNAADDPRGIGNGSHDHVAVLCGAFGQGQTDPLVSANRLWTQFPSGTSVNGNPAYAVAEIHPGEYVDITIWHVSQHKLWSGRLLAGENKITYPDLLVAI